jgi:hypothetical protein
LSATILHLSPKYEYPLKTLVAVAGYQDSQEGYRALADAMRSTESIYPEDILQRFIETAAEKGKFEEAPEGYVRAIQEILRGGIFNDSGVEAYAKPCAPMILGLMEIAAQSHHDTPSTCFILASADITNLGGLNRAERNRRKTDLLLQHLAQMPASLMDDWAKQQGYGIESLMIRTGGDEFKSIYRITRKDGQPIDTALLARQLQDETSEINQKIEHFSNHEHGMAAINHMKENRAPGVTNTVALRALYRQNPAIESTLQAMEADIAAARKVQGNQAVNGEQSPSFPMAAPPPRHPVAAFNPYPRTNISPGGAESLEQYSLRLALEKAGFQALAETEGLFRYDRKHRRARINQNHPDFARLSALEKNFIFRVLWAEELRGVIDPVSRTISAAFLDQCRALYKAQGGLEEYEIELKNLGGMNALSESLGDAVLRDIGQISERAYFGAFGETQQKPMIVQAQGGRFLAFPPPGATPEQLQNFANAITNETAQLNARSLEGFLNGHKLTLPPEIISNIRTIADIKNPKEASESCNQGLTVTVKEGDPHAQQEWRRREEDKALKTPGSTTEPVRGG